ncbi:MAG TPA: mechanosensitive ion channel domain-containing protein [Pseudolysinimonas sp.]|jgi:small-conductance mechanosensitive channel|nr:mechanosensitive ion channel domain-containing protein [Pseudolysinimonas sp.]
MIGDILADVLAKDWFWPALAVIIGLPIVLLVLGEVHTAMLRQGTPGARIVMLVRNVLAPLAAVIILFTQIKQDDGTTEFTWAKVAATAFGLVVVVILLSGLNLAIFVTAKQGTWRNRFPSIFVDIARLLIIAISLAVLFGWIWGADVGGLFTALGIGSIVIGLALQNAVGSVLSGLFLLFEQPFEIGEYIVTPAGKGRVVAMNWRATHLDTANGILVIPNSTLAGDTFKNLTRASSPYEASDVFRFATDDPPHRVIEVMVEVASGLPELHPGETPYAIPLDKAKFEINIALTSPAKQYMTLALFRTRLWYAARRAGLHLDRDLTDNYATPERVRENLLRLAPRFQITRDDAEGMVDQVRLERYGEGEVVQKAGAIPDGVRVIVEGVIELQVAAAQGAIVPVVQLKRDELLGLTALTRQSVGARATALTDAALLYIPVGIVDELVKTRPGLARDIGASIDHRQHLGEKALASFGEPHALDALVIA